MIMKLLSSEEEYYRIILEKYENDNRAKNFNVIQNNININNENNEEFNKSIYKQFLNNKSLSCWIDVFLFNSNFIFNEYLPKVNSERFEDLSKIEMLSVIVNYLKSLPENELKKGIFAILAIEPYSILSY